MTGHLPLVAFSHRLRAGQHGARRGPAGTALPSEETLRHLRAYGWSDATLSLGYFQHLAELERRAALEFVPRVRRATGGGAIWHHHELTYALVLPSPPSSCTTPHRLCIIPCTRRSPESSASRDRGPAGASLAPPAIPKNLATPALSLLRRQGSGGSGLRRLQGRRQRAEAAARGDPAARLGAAATLADDARVPGHLRPLRGRGVIPAPGPARSPRRSQRPSGCSPTPAEDARLDPPPRRGARADVYRDPAWTGRRR